MKKKFMLLYAFLSIMTIMYGGGLVNRCFALMTGPFIGINYDEKIRVVPDSKFVVSGNYVLEVYNNIDGRAPVIALRDETGKLLWAKLLVVSNVKGFERCKVKKLVLKGVRLRPREYVIIARVFWTFGWERANFYFDQEMNLIRFFLHR